MKAVIMAGGEGSRLRPLTCDRPKPMVPVGGRPVMAYGLDLLRRHGFREVYVTLQYMPRAITEHFRDGDEYDLSLHYQVEAEPRGTAGSVGDLAAHLPAPFVVVSGDALTDIDLSAMVDFHRRTGAVATLALTRVEQPLEYGVVLTDEDGRITRFLEKPGWSEVFSDTVNTGIYVLEPFVLSYIPTDRPFDFSRDLFPRLLAEGHPLFGYLTEGYWCDIGDLAQYLQANLDLAAGRVSHRPAGHELAPGLWVGEGAEIDPSAFIEGPAVLGDGCYLAAGAVLSGGVVLSAHCRLAPGASAKRSVAWKGVVLEPGAALRGAVVGDRVRVGSGSEILEGAVVASGAVLGEQVTVRPGVKIWPEKRIDAGAMIDAPVIWGTGRSARLLVQGSLRGQVGVDVQPETAARVGAAFGAVLPRGGTLVALAGPGRGAALVQRAVVAGLLGAGRQVHTGSTAVPAAAALALRMRRAVGGVHVRSEADGRVVALLMDQGGHHLGRDLQRKLENTLARDDFSRARADGIGEERTLTGLDDAYFAHLTGALGPPVLRQRPLRVRLTLPEGWGVARRLLEWLGCSLEKNGKPDVAAAIDQPGTLCLYHRSGEPLAHPVQLALQVLLTLRSAAVAGRRAPVPLPVWAPSALEALVHEHGREPVRVRQGEYDSGDPLRLLGGLLQWLAAEDLTLESALELLPLMHTAAVRVPCPWPAKGKLMRRLTEALGAAGETQVEGIRVRHSDGTVLLTADPCDTYYWIHVDAENPESAAALGRRYRQRLDDLLAEMPVRAEGAP